MHQSLPHAHAGPYLDMITVTLDNQPNGRPVRAWVAASALVGMVVAGLAVGWVLDRWLGTAPVMIAVCGLGSIVAAMVKLIRESRQ